MDDVVELQTRRGAVELRRAVPGDVPQVVALLAADQLGAVRDGAADEQVLQPHRRSSGLGTAMVGWAVDEARRRGCALVQLTTDERRTDAHRFSARLGFGATHEGMELHL